MKRTLLIIFAFLCICNCYSQDKKDSSNNENTKINEQIDYEDMLRQFKELFLNTHAPYPALVLGDMYLNGLGTTVDEQAALEYYTAVADISVAHEDDMELKIMVSYGCRAAGLLMLDEENMQKSKHALDYLMKAHKLIGDAFAEYLIGNLYEDGIGVEVNMEKAIEYYNLSRQKGCICATEHLACLYKESDPEQALSLHVEAANTIPYVHKNPDDIYSPLTTPNAATNSLVMESWNTAVYNVAHFLQEQGESGHALEYLDKLTILTPQRLALKAYCHALQDNKELALSEFAESLKMEETGYAYNMMAVLYEHKWDDSEKAELYYKKAISLGHKLAEDNYKRLLENKK